MTVLCDCETVINARPLTYLSDTPDGFIPLTPPMFLREQVDSGLPDCDEIDRTRFCHKML